MPWFEKNRVRGSKNWDSTVDFGAKINTLNAGNHITQNKTQPVLLIAASRFVEMLVPAVTGNVKINYRILIARLALRQKSIFNVTPDLHWCPRGKKFVCAPF